MLFEQKVKTCEICGKVFIPQELTSYTYKRTVNGLLKYFCSWSCMRKFDKERGFSYQNKEIKDYIDNFDITDDYYYEVETERYDDDVYFEPRKYKTKKSQLKEIIENERKRKLEDGVDYEIGDDW